MKHCLATLPLVIFLTLLIACSGAEVTQTPVPATSFPPGQKTGTGPSPAPLPTPTPTAMPTTMPLPVATPVFASPVFASREEAPSKEETWVRERLNAVVSLYNITTDGNEALQGLDVRHMRDQPGWFGSFGYKSWAGVGEAKPIGVIHELSHSYWGLFPVSGFPQLDWDPGEGMELSSAMQRYHHDVLEFMKQPPDHYELLRTRLRNLPELSASDTSALFHTIEADAIYTTAGDLDLMPPILRKYWDQLLRPGPFRSWYGAFAWYQGLPANQKKMADEYIGFEHFDLGGYRSLEAASQAHLGEGVEKILLQEKRQRLVDFVELFDLLLGTPEHKEDFKFWRGYLRDKLKLHKQQPRLLNSLNFPRSKEIAEALDFLEDIEGKRADEQADLTIRELRNQPFLVHFLPVLDDHTLLKLFSSEAPLPKGATLKGTAAFVESVAKFTPHIEKILNSGRQDISTGSDELTSYLKGVDFRQKEELELFFKIFHGADSRTAKGVVAALDDSMLRRLLVPVPVNLRILLKPPRFLEFLNITLDSSLKQLTQGIEGMVRYPSGNFRIDEPFLEEMYEVIATRGKRAPPETLESIAGSPFPMERFISLYPVEAADLLASDLNITSTLVKNSDPVVFPPARFVYRLIYAEPELAARVVEQLDRLGEEDMVLEALAHFAYDADRLQAVPGLPISLKRDGRFLRKLLEDAGAQWLESRIAEAVRLYRGRVEENEAPTDFLVAYERTLRRATEQLEDRGTRRALEDIISSVFR